MVSVLAVMLLGQNVVLQDDVFVHDSVAMRESHAVEMRELIAREINATRRELKATKGPAAILLQRRLKTLQRDAGLLKRRGVSWFSLDIDQLDVGTKRLVATMDDPRMKVVFVRKGGEFVVRYHGMYFVMRGFPTRNLQTGSMVRLQGFFMATGTETFFLADQVQITAKVIEPFMPVPVQKP